MHRICPHLFELTRRRLKASVFVNHLRQGFGGQEIMPRQDDQAGHSTQLPPSPQAMAGQAG